MIFSLHQPSGSQQTWIYSLRLISVSTTRLTFRMRMVVVVMMVSGALASDLWLCPQVKNVSCSCDLPRTLRCTGPNSALPLIARSLRKLKPPEAVSLLDCTIQEYTVIKEPLLQGVSLLGLVISSGDLKSVSENAFTGLSSPLDALGLPNNKLEYVPIAAISKLPHLTRLDLSYNQIQSLSSQALKGLWSLKVLDFSGNKINNISASTFIHLNQLKVLRLQLNNLGINEVEHLHGLTNLEQLDLSNNEIAGPLSNTTFPTFPHLEVLNLGHNQITSITNGALLGLNVLKTLILKHNMIDVLEDHSFRSLPTLTSLDLAHNRIVTVSEASLAHLHNLESLDVSHNFLRALTSDIVSPLQGLKELRLDDNDISMVTTDALTKSNLQILSLTDNPLNCDCSLLDFAKWLKSSKVSRKDRKTAVCATPPHLENGLVEDLLPRDLVCDGSDEFSNDIDSHFMPVSTRINYLGFSYDGSKISLLWELNPLGTYNCYALLVYEELGGNEVLMETNRLRCNSRNLDDPHSLVIALDAPHLQIGHRYRYSLVMIEKNIKNESALLLGRSEVILLHEKTTPQLISLSANLTNPHTIYINANVWSQSENCAVAIHIISPPKMIHQLKLNCSFPKVTIKELPNQGPFNICAVLPNAKPHCIWVQPYISPQFEGIFYQTALIGCFILFLMMVALLMIWYKMRNKTPHPKLPSPSPNEQNARYTKLLATTRL